MTVETVGNPPPEADKLRAEIETKLPEIITSFSRVLQEQYGYTSLRVGGFTIVPNDAANNGITCDEEGCSVADDR